MKPESASAATPRVYFSEAVSAVICKPAHRPTREMHDYAMCWFENGSVM